MSVYDIDLLAQKTGLQFTDEPVPLIGLPDSTILKYAKINVQKNGDKHFSIAISFSDQGLSKVTLDMEAETYIVRSMTMETVDQNTQEPSYKRIYRIEKIQHIIPSAAFDLRRFFAVNGGKVVPANKYAAYKLNTLTN